MKNSKYISKAFTLIELLVVIAIISLLVSILLPSLTKAKELARRVACASNQRNIGLAIQLYASDNDGYVPPRLYSYNMQSSSLGITDHFFNALFPEYVDSKEIFYDPDYSSYDPSGYSGWHASPETGWPDVNDSIRISYMYYGFGIDAPTALASSSGAIAWAFLYNHTAVTLSTRLTKHPNDIEDANPAEVSPVTCTANGDAGGAYGVSHYNGNNPQEEIPGGQNACYLDGHVTWRDASNIEQYWAGGYYYYWIPE